MKKLICILLALVFCAAILPMSAMADEAPSIVVEPVSVTEDEVVVTVSLKNNPGISGMVLDFDYDSDALELTGTESSGLKGNWAIALRAVWAGSESSFNGVILTLHFRVLEAAKGTAQPITVSYEVGNICNYDLEDVNFAIQGCTVELLSAEQEADTPEQSEEKLPASATESPIPSAVPETAAPETAAPESAVTETAAPESAVPEVVSEAAEQPVQSVQESAPEASAADKQESSISPAVIILLLVVIAVVVALVVRKRKL